MIDKPVKMVRANPTREFFVNMIIRDILLKQAIIELIDNSIDGARTLRADNNFEGLFVSVKFDENCFEIKDNCGGIPLDTALNRAFCFGRAKEDYDTETTGIFGIGMKRALFKLGTVFEIESKTVNDSFHVKLDVEEWKKDKSDTWDFKLDEYTENVSYDLENVGTQIRVTDLRYEIASEFRTLEFQKELIQHVERRVGLDIDHGIKISINNIPLKGNYIKLVNSDDVKPIKESYETNGVKVNIIAGIAERAEGRYEPENSGWYIYCNGRLIVAADKTSLTTWKDMENKSSGIVFNNTYASFQGTVFFNSKYPDRLPWNTTKTGIDESSLIYLEARERMIEVFKNVKNFIDAVRKRTKDEDDGVAETVASMPVIELTERNTEEVISNNRSLSIENVKIKVKPHVIVRYKKPKDEVELLKRCLGVSTNTEVGEKTFEYYKDAEC